MRRIKADWRDRKYYTGREYVLADPPWNYEWRHPKANAQVGAKFELWGQSITGNGGDLVRFLSLCDASTSAVFMWCTWSMLEEVISMQASVDGMRDKFTLRTVVTWIKLKERGGLKFGLGNSFRGTTEPLLVYVREKAKPPRVQMPNVFSEYSGPRTTKPKQFERDLVQALPGNWLYAFSGPETEWARGLEIDLLDKEHDLKRRNSILSA